MKNLKKLRAIKGITQAELAKQVGLTRTIINMYESDNYGKISLKSAQKLADYFGVSVVELYGIDNFRLIPSNDYDRLFLIKSIVNELENEELRQKIREIL